MTFAGCTDRAPTVVFPDETRAIARTAPAEGGTDVTFEAPLPGLYVILAADGGALGRVELYDVQDPDAGILRSFVDRVDNCYRYLYLTDQGRLVCSRDTEIWVYEADGSLHTHFPGGDVAVVGDEVWSVNAGAIEHRTDGDAGLHLDSTLPDPRLETLDTATYGATSPGRTVRGGPTEVIEYAWDAGALSQRSWDRIATGSAFMFTDGDELWGANLCTYRAGCQSILCEPIKICPFGENLTIAGLDEGRVWYVAQERFNSATAQSWLSVRTRPLAASASPSPPRLVPLLGALAAWPWSEGHPLLLGNANAQVVLLEDHGRAYFRLMSERVASSNRKWMISVVNPNTLRLTRQ